MDTVTVVLDLIFRFLLILLTVTFLFLLWKKRDDLS